MNTNFIAYLSNKFSFDITNEQLEYLKSSGVKIEKQKTRKTALAKAHAKADKAIKMAEAEAKKEEKNYKMMRKLLNI